MKLRTPLHPRGYRRGPEPVVPIAHHRTAPSSAAYRTAIAVAGLVVLVGCLERGKAGDTAANADGTATDGATAEGAATDGAATDGSATDGVAADPFGPRYWLRSAGGQWRDQFSHVSVANGGSALFVGTTASGGAGDWDAWLVAVDSCGAMVRSVAIGGAGKDEGHASAALSGGHHLVVGSSESYEHGKEAWVTRVDADLKLIWSRVVGGGGWDTAEAVTATTDDGAIVLGETYNFGPGAPMTHNALVFRLASDGGLVWEQTIGGGGEGDAGFEVVRVGLNGDANAALIAGATESYGEGRDDIWLVRIAGDGSLLWARSYGDEEDDEGRAVTVAADGSFWVTGFTRGFGAQKSDVYVLHTDAGGSALSMWRYGGSGKERGYGLTPRPGGWNLAGVSDSHDGTDDGFVAALDAAGDVVFMRRVGSDNVDEVSAVAAIGSQGDVVWAGMTESYGAGGRDAFFGRIRVDGEGGCKVRPWPAPWKRHEVTPKVGTTLPVVAHGAASRSVTPTITTLAAASQQSSALMCLSPACPPSP